MQNNKRRQSKKGYYPLCEKCKTEYPLLIILYYKSLEINLRCQCGFESTYSINEFIDYIKKSNATVVNLKCKKHNQPYQHYCYICQQQFCSKCFHLHNDIDYNVQISLNKINISQIQDLINTTKNYIKNTLSAITNKYDVKIKELRKAFSFYKERNNKNIFILQCLVNTYSSDYPNYYIEQSLRNNQLIPYDFDKYYSKTFQKTVDMNYYENFSDPNVMKHYTTTFAYNYLNDTSYLNVFRTNHSLEISSILFIAPCYLLLSCNTSILYFYNLITDTIDFSIDIKNDCTEKTILIEEGKILSYNNRECVVTSFHIHNNTIEYNSEKPIEFEAKNNIRVISISNNKIAISGHLDKEIIIQRITQPCEVITKLITEDTIYAEYYDKEKNKLLTAGYNYALIIWNVETYQKETVFNQKNYSTCNYMMQVTSGVYIVGWKHIVDLKKYTFKEIEDDDEEKYGLRLLGGIEMFNNDGLITSIDKICIPFEKINGYVEHILDFGTERICVDKDTFIALSGSWLYIWKY